MPTEPHRTRKKISFVSIQNNSGWSCVVRWSKPSFSRKETIRMFEVIKTTTGPSATKTALPPNNSCNIISHQSGQLQRLLEPYAAQTWRSMIPCSGETRWPANGRAEQSLNNLPCRKTPLKYDIALEILKSVKPAKHLHELLRLFWENVAPHMTCGTPTLSPQQFQQLWYFTSKHSHQHE